MNKRKRQYKIQANGMLYKPRPRLANKELLFLRSSKLSKKNIKKKEHIDKIIK